MREWQRLGHSAHDKMTIRRRVKTAVNFKTKNFVFFLDNV